MTLHGIGKTYADEVQMSNGDLNEKRKYCYTQMPRLLTPKICGFMCFMSFMGYFLPFFLGNEIVTALKLTFSRKLGIMSFR